DAGQLEAVHELRVGQPVQPRGGVDAGDPETAEVALAVAAVAVGVRLRLHQRFLGAAVVRVRLAAEALRPLEGCAALLARVDGTLDAGHEPEPSRSLRTVFSSAFEIGRSRPIS